jgi:hypothetical protein
MTLRRLALTTSMEYKTFQQRVLPIEPSCTLFVTIESTHGYPAHLSTHIFSVLLYRWLKLAQITKGGAGIAQWYSGGLRAEWSWVQVLVGTGNFSPTTASRQALGLTQPPIQWVSGVCSLGVKRPGREPDYSPPSNAEVKNVWSYNSTPPIRFHGMVLT